MLLHPKLLGSVAHQIFWQRQDSHCVPFLLILIQYAINDLSNIAIDNVSFYLTFLSRAAWQVPSPADLLPKKWSKLVESWAEEDTFIWIIILSKWKYESYSLTNDIWTSIFVEQTSKGYQAAFSVHSWKSSSVLGKVTWLKNHAPSSRCPFSQWKTPHRSL